MVLHPGFGNQQRGSIPTPSTIQAHPANQKYNLYVIGSNPIEQFCLQIRWQIKRILLCVQYIAEQYSGTVRAALTREVNGRHVPRLPSSGDKASFDYVGQSHKTYRIIKEMLGYFNEGIFIVMWRIGESKIKKS